MECNKTEQVLQYIHKNLEAPVVTGQDVREIGVTYRWVLNKISFTAAFIIYLERIMDTGKKRSVSS